jgi:hypothetical protein
MSYISVYTGGPTKYQMSLILFKTIKAAKAMPLTNTIVYFNVESAMKKGKKVFNI